MFCTIDRDGSLSRTHPFDLHLRNQGEDFVHLTDFATEFCGRYGLSDEERARLLVVCEELFTNVVTHGYEAGAEGHIDVELSLRDSRLIVQFVDDGRAFDPLANPLPDQDLSLEEWPGGGLGLAIVRGLADEIGYSRHGNQNRLTLARNIAQPTM